MAVPTVKTIVDGGGYVLHVVPANGGGVDRHVRDICALRIHDCILHAVAGQSVFEAVEVQRFFPIDDGSVNCAAAIQALGRPQVLHAHSTLAPVRDAVARLRDRLDVDYLLTLHDVDFVDAAAVAAPEREARLAFVENAAARVAPSCFILDRLRSVLPELATDAMTWVIENGVDAAPAFGFAVDVGVAVASSPGVLNGQAFDVVVIGALGPHKGLNFLLDVVAELPPTIRVVVVGYADGQLSPGWLVPNRIWVHGAFESQQLPGLVHAYGGRIAFFPNQQPESYCYALSDAWVAGLPTLGPAAGAIGERIALTGAGWIFDPHSRAEAVAGKILDCLDGIELQAVDVRQARAQLQSPSTMVARLNKLYEKTMKTTHAPPQLRALDTLIATQLNGQFFRGELQRLSGDLAFAQTQAGRVDAELRSLTHEYDGRAAWIATLEKNLAESQAEIVRIETARQAELTDFQAAHEAERQAVEDARREDRAQAEWARDQERAQAEAARHQLRAEAEAALASALSQARAEAQVVLDHDRALAAAALASERERAATVLATELARAEAIRLNDHALAEAALFRERAEAEARRLAEHLAHVQYAEKLTRDVTDTLAVAHRQERVIAIDERALSMIPPFIRRRMLARAERLIGVKDAS